MPLVVSYKRSQIGGERMGGTLGQRLAHWREQRGLTQKDIAKAVGLSPQQISGYERDYRTPPPDTLKELATLLRISTDYLLGLTDDPTPPSHDEGRAIRRDYPLPPIGYEDLSPEERERIDKLTREFERHTIELLLKEKREREEQQGR